MKKKLSVKLNDAMDKKVSADQSWQRMLDSLSMSVEVERIYLSMDMCDRADAFLLQEETLDRQRKIQRIHIDETSVENIQLEVERITKLKFIQELLTLKEPHVTTISTKSSYRRESTTNS